MDSSRTLTAPILRRRADRCHDLRAPSQAGHPLAMWSTVCAVTAPAGYSGTPLPRKLGVTAGSRVLLAGAPAGFDLGELPPGVVVHSRPGVGRYDVVLAFCPDARTLRRRFGALAG